MKPPSQAEQSLPSWPFNSEISGARSSRAVESRGSFRAPFASAPEARSELRRIFQPLFPTGKFPEGK